MEQLCFKYHCKEYFADDWTSKGFFSYYAGPTGAAQKDWPEFIEKLEMLRESGKNVILIAHSQVKQFENPDGPNYERYTPFLDKRIWAATHRWAPCIFFYQFQVDVQKIGIKHKAKSDTERRLICTVHSSSYDAKNRYGLDPIIHAGESGKDAYQAFYEAYEKCKQ
jgi:hypothetical protein